MCRDALQNRKIVGEGFPAGGGCGNDHILPLPDFFHSRCLVAVKSSDPLLFQDRVQSREQSMLRLGKPRLLGREILVIGYLGSIKAVPFQIFDKLAHKNLTSRSNSDDLVKSREDDGFAKSFRCKACKILVGAIHELPLR